MGTRRALGALFTHAQEKSEFSRLPLLPAYPDPAGAIWELWTRAPGRAVPGSAGPAPPLLDSPFPQRPLRAR